jgi:hypothetical protein
MSWELRRTSSPDKPNSTRWVLPHVLDGTGATGETG